MSRIQRRRSSLESSSSRDDHVAGDDKLVDFTPDQLFDRRLENIYNLEDQLERSLSPMAVSNSFVEECGVCSCISGSIVYFFTMNPDNGTFQVTASIYQQKSDEHHEHAQNLFNLYQNQPANSEMNISWATDNQDVILKQDISVDFLYKQSLDDFTELIDTFIEFSQKIRQAFKLPKKPRKGVMGLIRTYTGRKGFIKTA